MLAMNGHPFVGYDAGRHPEAGPEEPRDHRMQHDGAVRCSPVEINGRAKDRNLSHQQRHT